MPKPARILTATVLAMALSACASPEPPRPATPVLTSETDGGEPQPTARPPTQAALATPTEEPGPTPPAYIREMRFLQPGITAESLYHVSVRAWSMTVGVDDELLLLGDQHTVYRLEEGGQVSVYADLSSIGDKIEQIGVDPQGRLWASTNHSGIFRMDAQGQPQKITENTNRQFVIDSGGNLYAVDYPATQVVKITPDGELSVMAEGFGQGHKIAVTPAGEVLVVEDKRGELILIHADGTWETIVDGLTIDFGPVVSPRGEVYLIDWSGLYRVDLDQKTKTRVEWYQPFANTGESAVFDSRGLMYTYHANVAVFRIDLESQTLESLFEPNGNTFAMAATPTGRVFVAYGERIPGGHTSVYEVGAENALAKLAELPYREPRAMSISNDGMLLVSVKGPETAQSDTDRNFHAGVVYELDPDSGDGEIILEDCCSSLDSIVQNPVDGTYWWKSWDALVVADASGQLRRVGFPEQGIVDGRLKFSPDGTLYALFHKNNLSNLEADRAMYRLNDGQWERLYAGHEFVFDLALCQGDSLYTMGGTFDFADIVPGRGGILYLLWRLSPEGELIPVAYDAGTDQFALQCDAATNQLYFTNLEGVGKFVLPPEQ